MSRGKHTQPKSTASVDDIIRIGFQRNTPPFSYSPTEAFQPIGYSVDLIRRVLVDLYGGESTVPAVENTEVTSTTRENLLTSGLIDLECGSTTITKARLERVAFSIPIFRTSHCIAVGPAVDPSATSTVQIFGIDESTSQRALESYGDIGFEYRFTGLPSIGASVDAFLADDSSAMVADEIILRSLIGSRPGKDLRLLGFRMGSEHYGFMMRHGARPAVEAVNASLHRIFGSPEFRVLTNKWFGDVLPGTGFSLDMTADDEAFATLGLNLECEPPQ